MYCPFCGCGMLSYHVRHANHKIAYQCQSGLCAHSAEFIAIEFLGSLTKHQIIRRHIEPKEEHHDPPL